MEYQVVFSLSTYLLKRSFRFKRIMAQTLGIPYRSLLRVFNDQSSPGDVQRTMNAIAAYCMEQRIPPEELFADFVPVS